MLVALSCMTPFASCLSEVCGEFDWCGLLDVKMAALPFKMQAHRRLANQTMAALTNQMPQKEKMGTLCGEG